MEDKGGRLGGGTEKEASSITQLVTSLSLAPGIPVQHSSSVGWSQAGQAPIDS